jgi:hypothetical protein
MSKMKHRRRTSNTGPIPPPRIAIQPANSTIPCITLRLPPAACYHSACLLLAILACRFRTGRKLPSSRPDHPPSKRFPRSSHLHNGYPYALQRKFLSLFFSIHLPPVVAVVAQQERSYPLSFHPLANTFLSNRGVHPLPSSRVPDDAGAPRDEARAFATHLFREDSRVAQKQAGGYRSLTKLFLLRTPRILRTGL